MAKKTVLVLSRDLSNVKGGMAVHTSRLIKHCEGTEYEFQYLLKGNRWLNWVKSDVIYIISTNQKRRVIFALLGFIWRKKVIVRIGGRSLGGRYGNLFESLYLYMSNAVIVVNKDILVNSKLSGHKKVSIIPGFIWPDTVRNLYLTTFDYDFGTAVAYTKEDIYGIDLLISFARLKPQSEFLVYCYDLGDSVDTFSFVRSKVGSLGNIHVKQAIDDVHVCLSRCKVFLRLTSTDGDSNLLREMLWHGRIVVATNVIKRPAGCIVIQRSLNALESLNWSEIFVSSQLSDGEVENNANKIINLLDEIFSMGN